MSRILGQGPEVGLRHVAEGSPELTELTRFAALATAGTLPAGSIEDYQVSHGDLFRVLPLTPDQKVTVVSPDGKLVLVAGNNDVRVNIYSNLALSDRRVK